MAEVARLGLVVDADGAVKQIRLTSSELAKLADQSVKTGASLKSMAGPQTEQHIARVNTQLRLVNTTAAASAPGLGRLQNALSGAAIAAAGLPGPLGRVASSLGMFTMGGGITVAVIAGIAAIAFAFKKLTADTNAALTKFQEFSGFSRNALTARLGMLQGREANLVAGREATGLGYGDRGFDATLTASIRRGKELERTRELIGQISIALNKMDRDAASAATSSARLFDAEVGFFAPATMDAINQGLREHAQRLADAATEAEKFRKAFSDPTSGAFGGVSQEDIQNVIQHVQEVVRTLEEAEQKAAKMRASLAGTLLGGAAGLLSRSGGIGGAVSGAVMGGFGGAAGGPAGIAAGAAFGLVEGLFAMADAAKQARDRLRQFRQGLEDIAFEMKDGLTDLDRALQQNRRMFDDIRRSLSLDMFKGSPTERLNAFLAELARINDLEGQRAEWLTKQSEQMQKQQQLADQIRSSEDRIGNLTNIIAGLQSFRSGLAISEQSGLSPTDRLATARGQYENLLRAAQGGIKIPGYDGVGDIMFSAEEQAAAAAQLPAAAQALLELSRLVNASGAGFQADFQKVMEDTNGLIGQFISMRSVEELMLEELKRIRDNTGTIAGTGTTGGTGGTGGGGGTPGTLIDELQAQTVALSSGFSQLIDEVRDLRESVDRSAGETRRAVVALT